MGYKKLISPEFKISTEHYEITRGCEVECFSSREARSDWCRVELATQYDGIISYGDNEEAVVELGYDEDYDILLSGYCRKNENDSWKEIMIRDDMIKLEQTMIKATFIDCTPQDAIRYILTQAGISDYVLAESEYGKKILLSLTNRMALKPLWK